MPTAAYYVLHYGKEWLHYSIRSIIESVDKVFIFYTPTPSFGHNTVIVNPDSKQDLLKIAVNFIRKGYNLEWLEPDRIPEHEGIHRTWAVNECYKQGYDTILVVDQDEIWDPDNLRMALYMSNSCTARSYLVNMRHFFRSLHWVCNDGAWPCRIVKPGNPPEGIEYLGPERIGKVYHMGYAQSSELIRYKMAIHGHFGEIRPGWFDNIFMPWRPGLGDVHPTNLNYWTPEPYSDGICAQLFGDHPYWDMEIIP